MYETMSDWVTFLQSVDEPPAADDLIKTTEQFLISKAKLSTPLAATGITLVKLEAVDGFPKELPVQTFLSRTVDTLDALAAARRASLGAGGGSAAAAPSASSALAMAQILAPPKVVDTVALLRGAHLDDLPFALQIDQPMIERMSAETDSAKRSGRKPFLFVELASKEILPLWVTPESVGGRPEEEVDQLQDKEVSSLAKLGAALRGATEGKRCFTSVAQWSSAYMRYVPFAVSLGHLTWAESMVHFNTIMQLVEEEKLQGRGPAVAFVYDELIRRQLERRCAKGTRL